MADVALTEQNVFSWGSFRAEQGKFTDPAAAFQIRTKLGRLIWAEIASMNAVEDGVFSIFINSASASSVEDDPGVIHCADEFSAGDYTYFAIGKG